MEKKLRETFLGSVVRRRTYNKFSIVESLYRPHEQLRQHSHARAFVSVTLRGGYSEKCGNKTHECLPGEAIFHAAEESHEDCFSQVGGHILNVEISPNFLTLLTGEGFAIRARTQTRNPHIAQVALRLQQELTQTDLAADLAVEGLALELFSELLREPGSAAKKRKPDWLRTVRDILHDRYYEALTLSELAQSVDIHPVYLARAFRQQNHCSIGDYIRKLRVAAACHELAASTLTLPDVAAKTGFSDQSHLSRTLKRHTGMSPNQFRQHSQQIAS